MAKKYTITYKDKTLETDHFCDISDEKCEELRQQFYVKPDFSEVRENLIAIKNGSTKVSRIANYYVKDLMANTKLYSPKWSIAEVFECNDLIRYFYSRILASDTIYPKTASDIDNLETALRISGGGVAMKPSNFPMRTVDYVLKNYNVNNNYYDFSCGWGVRMLSALKNKVNYFGTDPNYVLIDRLKQMHNDYDSVNSTKTEIDIRPIGSEIFQKDWENKIGVAFSSPPYFTLEDYRIGEQSIKNRDYDQWKQEYLRPTIENIKKYLIDGGYVLVNIKNFSKYKLFEDTFFICQDLGLTYVETLDMKNNKRPSAKKDINTDEKIMVFKKGTLDISYFESLFEVKQ